MTITTRKDLVGWLQSVHGRVVEAQRRLPDIFKGQSDIRKVADDMVARCRSGGEVGASEVQQLSEALCRAAAGCEYAYDILFGVGLWTKTELEKLSKSPDDADNAIM